AVARGFLGAAGGGKVAQGRADRGRVVHRGVILAPDLYLEEIPVSITRKPLLQQIGIWLLCVLHDERTAHAIDEEMDVTLVVERQAQTGRDPIGSLLLLGGGIDRIAS